MHRIGRLDCQRGMRPIVVIGLEFLAHHAPDLLCPLDVPELSTRNTAKRTFSPSICGRRYLQVSLSLSHRPVDSLAHMPPNLACQL